MVLEFEHVDDLGEGITFSLKRAVLCGELLGLVQRLVEVVAKRLFELDRGLMPGVATAAPA